MYLKVLGLQLLLIGFGSSARIVCYYQSWAMYNPDPATVQPEELDASLCTHVNYAFISVQEDGQLKVEDDYLDIQQGGFRRVVEMKNRNPNLKVLLSVGGGAAGTDIFKSVAADPGKRATMVGSSRWFLETYGFDGLDMDWEIPEAGDRDNFIALLRDLKNDFDRNGWELTAAVRCDPEEGYDVPQMNQILTAINIMTYDMYGPWSSYTGQNSPLYASSVESDWEKSILNIHSSVQNWQNAGTSPEKIIVGLAFYGRTFTLQDQGQNGLHSPISGPGRPGPYTGESGGMSYLEYCVTDWDCWWDDEQKNPICVNGDQWLGVDNEDSIKIKVDYIKQNNLGGAMIWSIDQDDVHGTCGREKVLMHAVADNLK